jgi:hypothetical protein
MSREGRGVVDREMSREVRGERAEIGRDAAVGWREADRALRRLAARRAALDAEETRWLLIARRENVHERFGYGALRVSAL